MTTWKTLEEADRATRGRNAEAREEREQMFNDGLIAFNEIDPVNAAVSGWRKAMAIAHSAAELGAASHTESEAA